MTSIPCTNPACRKPSPDPLCWDCTRRLYEILADVRRIDWQLLDILLFGAGSGGDGSRPHWPPLPFDADASQFRDALRILLVGCVRETCERRGVEWLPLGATDGAQLQGYVPTIVDLAMWLQHHAVSLRLDDTAGETLRQLREAVERGDALIARQPPAYRGPCPTVVRTDERGKPVACGVALYGPRGDAYVACPACKTLHDAEKLEQRHLADMGNMLFGVNDLLRVLRHLGEPIAIRTLYEWRSAGKIRPARWRRPDGTLTAHWIHRADAPMYRLVDVRRVRADSAAAKSRKDTREKSDA